jgi:hypothetical protein
MRRWSVGLFAAAMGVVVLGVGAGAVRPVAAGAGVETRVPLEGVWRITERITPAGHPRANGVDVRQTDPQANLLIFTEHYYSEVIEMGQGRRPEAPEPADPLHLTDAEKLACYNQWRPFTANSGTYEIHESVLTRHAIVAKNLNAMRGGTGVPFDIRVEDENTIWLMPAGTFTTTEPRIKLTRLE